MGSEKCPREQAFYHIGGFFVRDLAIAIVFDCLPVASLEVWISRQKDLMQWGKATKLNEEKQGLSRMVRQEDVLGRAEMSWILWNGDKWDEKREMRINSWEHLLFTGVNKRSIELQGNLPVCNACEYVEILWRQFHLKYTGGAENLQFVEYSIWYIISLLFPCFGYFLGCGQKKANRTDEKFPPRSVQALS